MKSFVNPEKDLEPCDEEMTDEMDEPQPGDVDEDTTNDNNSDERDKVEQTNDKVTQILDKMWTRNEHNRLEPKYYVEWKNQKGSDNSWVSPQTVDPCLIEEFERNYKQKREKKISVNRI